MKAVVAAFNQEKALVGAFSVIVQPVVEPMDRFTALFRNNSLLLAEPKTIYKLEDKGQKFVTPSGDPDKSAYRSY